MENIILDEYHSTFVSNTKRIENFSLSNYLSISNCFNDNYNYISNTLIKFRLSPIKKLNISVVRASLSIPIAFIKSDKDGCLLDKRIDISYNKESYSSSKVTWNSTPNSCLYKTTPISQSDYNNRYISVDITTLVKKWLSKKLPNFGLTLSTSTPNLLVIINKENVNLSPKLIIEYSRNDELNNSAVAIQLQSRKLNGYILRPFERILFDKIICKTPRGICYDKKTGIITIKKKGYYTCNWIINIEGSSAEGCSLNFALKNITKGKLVNFNMPVVLQGQLVGTALINTTEDLERFVLINNENCHVQLCDIYIQSSLLISSV